MKTVIINTEYCDKETIEEAKQLAKDHGFEVIESTKKEFIIKEPIKADPFNLEQEIKMVITARRLVPVDEALLKKEHRKLPQFQKHRNKRKFF